MNADTRNSIQKLIDLRLIENGVSENYKTRIKELEELSREQIKKIKEFKKKYPNVDLTTLL